MLEKRKARKRDTNLHPSLYISSIVVGVDGVNITGLVVALALSKNKYNFLHKIKNNTIFMLFHFFFIVFFLSYRGMNE